MADVTELRALVVDWGGVLTTDLKESLSAWASSHGIDYLQFRQAMLELMYAATSNADAPNLVHALERGELERTHFEAELASRLRTLDGQPVDSAGLLIRMFEHFKQVPAMSDVVGRARRAGLKTGLLSNSWGNDYPRQGWDDLFDAVVISGEIGMRKPDPEIYQYTVKLLGCEPGEVVFVDDLPVNVRGAVTAGLVGVVHRGYEETVMELEALFGIALRN
jgi:putative hydrolase of the HAD superfamily